jgi:hypothetical protein
VIKMMCALNANYDGRKSFYGKAQVEINNNIQRLYSYGTLVAEIVDGKLIVRDTYSATTLRHIKEFAQQNGFFALNKQQIINDYVLHCSECK